ncbi:MAG: aromatic amino acid ammonia-lyase [Leptospiraceae bacterium]|nr:aromatic amino acid ammonia-lyase [Leptospiraceae bacterium]MDW7975702.1 aromatic amino acid ammonia-lyase [Leptospiraceae bacterium]
MLNIEDIFHWEHIRYEECIENLATLNQKEILISNEQRKRIQESFYRFLELEKIQKIYGIHTGLGPFVKFDNQMSSVEFLDHLIVGTGNPIPEEVIEYSLLFRVLTMSRGFSGVRTEFLDFILFYYHHKAFPVVFERGSLGASGDLIPLAMILNSLIGRSKSFIKKNNKIYPSKKFIKKFQIKVLELHKKEVLSFINGISVSKAYFFFSLYRFFELLKIIHELFLLNYILLNANEEHFDNELLKLNRFMHHDLIKEKDELWRFYKHQISLDFPRPLQEIYSLRCGYQILGAVWEQFQHVATSFQKELFSIDDNPLIIRDRVVHGGNFFGQNLAFLSDQLNLLMVQLGVWIERLMKTLLYPDINPITFLGSHEPKESFGLAGLELLSSSLIAELRAKGNFHSTYSVPTNGGNQDIVPMANLSVRKTYQQLDLLLDLVISYFIVILNFNQLLSKTHSQKVTHFSFRVNQYFSYIIKHFGSENLSHLIQKVKRKFYQITS